VDNANTERVTAVHKLYRKTFRQILGTIAADRDLLALQAFDAVNGLEKHLARYEGPLDEYSFLLWALSILEPASKFIVILSKYQKLIRSRIRLELRSNVEDAAYDEEDCFQEISLLVFQHLDSLSKRGAARLPTRLTGLIRRHCGFIHKKRQNRYRIVSEHPEEIGSRGVAVLSEMELASQRFEESGEDGDGSYTRFEDVG